MTEPSHLDSQYDAFLFAPLCDADEVTLSVLSVLARQDVDPWQEAARLKDLSKDQATSSLAAKIWKSNSERWTPSEASLLAARLIELLPSQNPPRYNSGMTNEVNESLTFWMVAGVLFMSIALSGNTTQNSKKDFRTSVHGVSMAVQQDAPARSQRTVGSD